MISFRVLINEILSWKTKSLFRGCNAVVIGLMEACESLQPLWKLLGIMHKCQNFLDVVGGDQTFLVSFDFRCTAKLMDCHVTNWYKKGLKGVKAKNKDTDYFQTSFFFCEKEIWATLQQKSWKKLVKIHQPSRNFSLLITKTLEVVKSDWMEEWHQSSPYSWKVSFKKERKSA